ncbi:D-beta-hydroxybutyrate dehydrogenase, mitochondrial [Mizuhopecten yessoensis]|uniref:D-beta-hydroxybutyrate dehydrogenase, mitochondrial n=1 Tax=Mizuhopecten yessoensis TaxID=6573 RepID=A0A210QP32_MIZYE|nr:D-beta-hydroxybutyrate dehydrogenase, mitochondrial [Mizuhopecten yessoensis]
MAFDISRRFYEICHYVCFALVLCNVLYRHLFYIAVMLLCYVGVWIYKRSQNTWMDINGQGILITGCDTGFGFHAVERFHDLGYTIIAGVLNMESKGAQKLRKKKSKRLHIVKLDVTSDTDVMEAVKYIQSKRLGLWGVVSNAGINFPGDVELTTTDQFQKVAEVNLYGGIRVIKGCLPLVRRSKGRVVVISSARGLYSWPGESAYNITKHGIETMADCLRLEMRKFGVKVVVVQPGDFDGATSIMSPIQLERIKQEFGTMWENASDEVRSTYGKEYLDNMYQARSTKMIDITPVSPDPITDAIQQALFRSTPFSRYFVGGTDGYVDIVGVSSAVMLDTKCLLAYVGHKTTEHL